MFILLLIIQLFQLQMKVEMLFHGPLLEQKALKDPENPHLTQHKLQQMMLEQKPLNKV